MSTVVITMPPPPPPPPGRWHARLRCCSYGLRLPTWRFVIGWQDQHVGDEMVRIEASNQERPAVCLKLQAAHSCDVMPGAAASAHAWYMSAFRLLLTISISSTKTGPCMAARQIKLPPHIVPHLASLHADKALPLGAWRLPRTHEQQQQGCGCACDQHAPLGQHASVAPGRPVAATASRINHAVPPILTAQQNPDEAQEQGVSISDEPAEAVRRAL